MNLWFALAVPVALAVFAVVRLGQRDGWLGTRAVEERAEGPELPQRQFFVGNADFVGIAEVARFSAMRRRVGYQAANRIMRILADRIAGDERFEVGRVGSSTVEFLYRADSVDVARAMMEALKQRLEASVLFDTIEFEPEIAIGSNPVSPTRLRGELFDVATFAVEDARFMQGRISLAGDLSGLSETDRSANMLFDLREAIRGDALNLHYMPKLRLSDDTIGGAEALCRWTHPAHGVVPPMTFIKLAEDAGLIGDLTLWTLRRAVHDQQQLMKQGIELDIDVNLSALLIGSTEFCTLVMAEIGRSKGRIGLEITETGVIQDSRAALENLERIRDAGIRVAIDDFGSGLSSLAYLRELPAHELKIDQMFIRALTTSNRDPLLVRSAIDIAHALEMEVTAEGVEDEIALALLRVMRCDNVQGYHISPPLPLPQLMHYLRTQAHKQILSGAPRLGGALPPLRSAG